MHIQLYDSELNGGQGSSQTHLEKTIHPALSSPHELVGLRILRPIRFPARLLYVCATRKFSNDSEAGAADAPQHPGTDEPSLRGLPRNYAGWGQTLSPGTGRRSGRRSGIEPSAVCAANG